MPLNIVRQIKSSILKLDNPEAGLFKVNHIFEPEFHQDIYVRVSEELETTEGAYQVGTCPVIIKSPQRGIQPHYADDENDATSLEYVGMLKNDGECLEDLPERNICALKSISVRSGYVDFDTARSVSRKFYNKNKNRAGVIKNDVLINSTGDGTIGRVAIYNEDFPALVDGHITILRFSDPNIAWYIGAYLLSTEGQNQIYRYINGSSGQVEIYPQDIARIWIRPATSVKINEVAKDFMKANNQHKEFRINMRKALFNAL